MANIFRDPNFASPDMNWWSYTKVSATDGVYTATSNFANNELRPIMAGNARSYDEWPVFDNGKAVAGKTYKLGFNYKSPDNVRILAGVAHNWQIDEVLPAEPDAMAHGEVIFTVPEGYSYSASEENGVGVSFLATVDGGQTASFANMVLDEFVETKVIINDPGPQNLMLGQPVRLVLTGTTTHTDPTLTWFAEPLPPGLTLEGNVITGAPEDDGTTVTHITAMDGNGSIAKLDITWTVGIPNLIEPGSLEELDEAARALAPRLLKLLREDEDTDNLAAAQSALAQVISFVHAYTRGWGFGPREKQRPVGVDSKSTEAISYSPIATPLKQVIINAAVRLYTNPEQVYNYTANDYSERPAALTGFLLVEQATLNRYRRRTA